MKIVVDYLPNWTGLEAELAARGLGVLQPNDQPEILLVGEDNPYGDDPRFALYPAPRGCSGHRLMEILGLPEQVYLQIHRANLCAFAWTLREAREKASRMCVDRSAPWRIVVLLGRKVADAFGYELPFFTTGIEPTTACWTTPITLVSLPHPSGRNTVWNAPATRERAREILRELSPALPWGSTRASQQVESAS